MAGAVNGRTVLVQGAAGSVGLCAVQLARRAGARVIGTVRSSEDAEAAENAGAHEVVRNQNEDEFKARMKELAPQGVDHIVEVAFGANIAADVDLLKMMGRSQPMRQMPVLRRFRLADGVQEHSALFLGQ